MIIDPHFQLIHCTSCNSPPEKHQTLIETFVSHNGHLHGKPLRVATCSNCGLTFLNPQPKPEPLAKFYEHEYHAHRKILDKATQSAKKNWQKPLLYEWLANNLPEIKGWRILDIGCGYGEWLSVFPPSNHLIGIEQSVSAAKSATELYGVDVKQGDFMDNGLAEESIDLVTGLAIIEHFLDPLAAIVEVNRVLKPGGFAYMRTPDLMDPAFRKGTERYFKLVHTYYFSEKSLSALFEKAGFQVVAIRRRASVLPPSEWLHPTNSRAGELDVLARKIQYRDLDKARMQSTTSETVSDIRAMIGKVNQRDKTYLRLKSLYRTPVLGKIAKGLVKTGYLLTGRSLRKANVAEIGIQQVSKKI